MSDDRREAVARSLRAASLVSGGDFLHMADSVLTALSRFDAVETTEAEVRDAAWKIVDACEAAIQHSYVDYGDGIDALIRGNQYDRLHISPAIDALVALIAARNVSTRKEHTPS
jgi:hypothetical protein